MRNRFDEQLDLLNAELIRMGSLCEEVIIGALKVLQGETEYAGQVYQADHEIDQKSVTLKTYVFVFF